MSLSTTPSSSLATTDENGENPYLVTHSEAYKSRSGQTIENIAIHIVGTNKPYEECSLESMYNQFNTSDHSSNYGVMDGEVAQFINEENVAFSNDELKLGYKCLNYKTDMNNNSVTMEVVNYVIPEGTNIEDIDPLYIKEDGTVFELPITKESMDTTIKLCADICERNGLESLEYIESDGLGSEFTGTLIRHCDIENKECPGDFIIYYTDYIEKCANELMEKGYYIPDSKFLYDGIMDSVPLGGLTIDEESTSALIGNTNLVTSNVSSILSASSKFDTGTITSDSKSSTNSFLSSGVTGSLGSLSGYTSALNEKMKYDLCTLVLNAQDVISSTDSSLASLTDALGGEEVIKSIANIAPETYTEILSSSTTFTLNADGVLGSISKSDIQSLLNANSSFNKSIDSALESITNDRNALSNFSNELASSDLANCEYWKLVLNKITGSYDTMLNDASQAYINFREVVSQEMAKVLAAMGEYDNLSSDRLPELESYKQQLISDREEAETNLAQAKADLEEAQAALAEIDSTTIEGAAAATALSARIESLETTIANLTSTIESLTITINETQKEIDTTNATQEAYNTAITNIDAAYESIASSYGQEVVDLQTGTPTTYVAPSNAS